MTDSFQNTVLTLSGVGVPPYSARGLTQSLRPIGASSQTRRTINGQLRDLSGTQFKKYATTITGNDQQPPAVDGIWPGLAVNVGCITELAVAGEYDTESELTEATLGRVPVSGSLRVEDGFTFYRPILAMRIIDFSVSRDEWGAQVGWTMDLEEV